jgi:phosphoribosyl-ATP pyrophosphohydrolase/phosphoribosyl-AMP cyclohydrolase
MSQLDFEKGGGLIPVIIQEEGTNEVLMLGFMNREAWEKTQEEEVVWFYSRSKKRLWMKGETTGHILRVRNISVDCDKDALLIQVSPREVVCHQGTKSCFQVVGGQDD